jgi:hypothetical protein
MDAVSITRNFTVKDAKGRTFRSGPFTEGGVLGLAGAAPLTVGQRSAQRLLLRSEGAVNSTIVRYRSSDASAMRNLSARETED